MSEFIIVSNDLAPSVIEVSSSGPQGSSGTVSVGTVTTGASGSAAAVTNSGTPSAAVLNFTIPKGDIGDVTPAATAAKNAAEAAATAAAASELAAETAEQSAGTFASNASSSATAASASAATATTKAQEASTSASNAAASAESVLTAANTATTKAQEADASAYAASLSADTAATKAQEASTSATTADTKAQEAVVSANVATNKAQEASASAVIALSAQQISTENATVAIAQGNLATTKAAEADASANEALVQASIATAQAQEATAQVDLATAQAVISTTQAGISTAQATISTTQADIATTQANTSTAQATIATTQASNAEASAVQAAGSASAALASQVAAAGSATSATNSANSASGSAASALAIYGTTAAQQAALTNAQSAASLAQGYALSASSAIQQDLSGVTAQALHRSPNAVTAMFVYDTSKDSDGGAWTEKCQHTSWYNEALNGKWLGAQASELYARNQGATLGANQVAGSLATDVSGFTFSNGGSLEWVSSGRAKLVSVEGTRYATMYATFTNAAALELNALYEVSVDVAPGTYTGNLVLNIEGSNATGGVIKEPATVAQTLKTYHIPTSSAHVMRLRFEDVHTAGQFVYVSNFRYRKVTALTTASGDYYQSTVDGKFYRFRKNLLSYTDDFSNSYWLPRSGNATRGVNTLASTTTNGNHYVGVQNVASIAGQQYAFSCSFKPSGYNYVGLYFYDLTTTKATSKTFRIDNGTIASQIEADNGLTSIASISGPDADGYYRCSIATSAVPGGNAIFDIRLYNNAPAASYAGDGVSGVFAKGAQVELGSTATTYEAKTADGSVSETFRGNKADFPRLAGIVAEAASVTIYDLTEAGRPMWMRFAAAGNVGSWAYITASQFPSVNGLSSVNGLLSVTHAGTVGCLSLLSFSADTVRYYRNANNYGNAPRAINIAARQSTTAPNAVSETPSTLNNSVGNAVAMTVLPDAPVDAVTGLQTPTIAVATGGGVSVIKHDGAVVNSSSTSARTSISLSPTILTAASNGGPSTVYALNPGALGPSFATSLLQNNGALVELGQKKVQPSRSRFLRYNNAAANIGMTLMNEGTPARAIGTQITNTFNTGHLVGDIRRAYLADVDVGSASGTELVVNGDFSNGTAGWTANQNATLTVTDGVMKVVAGNTGQWGECIQAITTVVGKTYRVSLTNMGGTGTLYIRAAAVEIASSTVLFVATSTTTNIIIKTGSATLGVFVTFDNISVQEAVADRSYKAANAPITGTLTKTPVALGSQLVAYSGFSA